MPKYGTVSQVLLQLVVAKGNLESNLKGKQIKRHSESFLCELLIKSRGPTVISDWSKNRSCVLI